MFMCITLSHAFGAQYRRERQFAVHPRTDPSLLVLLHEIIIILNDRQASKLYSDLYNVHHLNTQIITLIVSAMKRFATLLKYKD